LAVERRTEARTTVAPVDRAPDISRSPPPHRPLMHHQLCALAEEYRRAGERLDAVVGSLSEKQWGARPVPSAWSVAENVGHLNLTSEAMLPGLRGAVAQAIASGESGPGRYRCDPVGWMFAGLVGPLPRIRGRRRGRVSTAPDFVPGRGLGRAAVLSRFRELQDEKLALLNQADGRPIQRFKVASPFVKRVRYNAYATFLILVRHQHRHLQQAEEAAKIVGGR